MSLIIKYWFFLGIAIMILIAFSLPEVGGIIRTYRLLSIGIFISFLLTGLSLNTSSIIEQLKNVKVLIAAIVSSLFLFPVSAYLLGRYFFQAWPDFTIGVLIVGVAPVTIASGTVMTAIALGNVPLSLFICVLCNFLSIFTMPFLLSLFLQFGDNPIELPVLRMLNSLTLKVLIPTLIGQMLRPWLQNTVKQYTKHISVFNQFIVLLIILNAVSSSTTRILQAEQVLFLVFFFMLGLHLAFLLINHAISRLIRLDLPSTAAFTIHTSQKALAIAYLVWAGYFAVDYPMALIPAITYHLTQMIIGTIVAHWFRRKAEFADVHSLSG